MAHIVERQGMCRTLSRKDCRPGKGSCKVQYSTDRPLLHRGNSLQTDLFKGQHRTFSPAFFLFFLANCMLYEEIQYKFTSKSPCGVICTKRKQNDNVQSHYKLIGDSTLLVL